MSPSWPWKYWLTAARPNWALGRRDDGTGQLTASFLPYWYLMVAAPPDPIFTASQPRSAQKSALLMRLQFCWKMGSNSWSTIVPVSRPALSALLLRQPSGPSRSLVRMSISPASWKARRKALARMLDRVKSPAFDTPATGSRAVKLDNTFLYAVHMPVFVGVILP